MAFKVQNTDYTITMISGDDEYIRLNIKDEDGNIIDVSTDVTCTMGIKRKDTDDAFLIPEKLATMYTYDRFDQPYSIELAFSNLETAALLNYNGKARSTLTCVYDIELHDTHLGNDDRTTILSGPLNISRSIGGKVV